MKEKSETFVLRKNRSPIILIILGIATVFTMSGQTGRSTYDFLNIPTSSHIFGLGGSNVSIIDADVTLADQNPALIGPEIGKDIAVNYLHWLGSANFAGIRYGMGAGEHGAWAVGIRYLNYGEFQGYESDGTYIGSFTPADIVFEGTYSHDFTYRLRGGINVKGIYSTYEEYTAFALAADLGINYYDDDHDLSVGVVLRNMGGQIKRFEETYDRLPFDLVAGVTKGLGTSFSFSVTAQYLTRWKIPYYDREGVESVPNSAFAKNLFRHLVFGVQYQPSEKFYIDLAYNYKTRSDMSAYQRNFLSGFSIGAGFGVRGFSVGVAYAMPHKSASTILLNIGFDIESVL